MSDPVNDLVNESIRAVGTIKTLAGLVKSDSVREEYIRWADELKQAIRKVEETR